MANTVNPKDIKELEKEKLEWEIKELKRKPGKFILSLNTVVPFLNIPPKKKRKKWIPPFSLNPGRKIILMMMGISLRIQKRRQKSRNGR
ncbi:MAG: hypothetical protein WKF97_11850 [Chitinophagaceae bacterium]